MDAGQGNELARNYLDRLRQLEDTLGTLGATGGQARFGRDPPEVTWYVDRTCRAVADAALVASLSRDTNLLTAGWALPTMPALPRISRVPGQPDRLTVADDAEAWRIASILADATRIPFLYRVDLEDAPVVHFLAVWNLRAPAPPPPLHGPSEALGAGFSYYLAAFGLLALALCLGLWSYELSSLPPGRGGPLSGMNGVVGALATLAAVCVSFIAVGVGAVGFKLEKHNASPPSIGGDPPEQVPFGGLPYRRMDVACPPRRRASPLPASVRRLGVCSFVATLLPWLGVIVDHAGPLILFGVIAVMLWLVASMMTASAWGRLDAYPDFAEVRDIRHAKRWLVAGALSLGFLFALV